MNPQYIKLTAVKMTVASPRGNQPTQMMVLQPPVERLLPLPLMFTKNQQDGRTEVEAPGMVVTYRERFDDVVAAIGEAALLGKAIALVVDRDAIAEASTFSSSAMRQQREYFERTRNTPTVQQAVETAVNGVKAALDEDELNRQIDNGEIVHASQQACDAIEKAFNSEGYVKNGAAVDENDPKWKDFVQTDGENVGGPLGSISNASEAPAYSRDPAEGDLRINSLQKGRFFLEQAYAAELHGEPIINWAAPNAPFALLRTFDSRDELIEAVHKAGRGKLLVNA